MNTSVEIPEVFKPIRISDSQRLCLAKSLLLGGSTIHSKNHGTLLHVLDFCERACLGYQLTAKPGLGYEVKIDPNHTVTYVRITYAVTKRTMADKRVIRLTLKDLKEDRLYLAISQSPEGITRFIRTTGIFLRYLRPVSRLRGHGFFCHVLDDEYKGVPYKKAIPIKVWAPDSVGNKGIL